MGPRSDNKIKFFFCSKFDIGSTKVRRQILLDFIELHTTITEPELESEFAQSASLFFTRISKLLSRISC